MLYILDTANLEDIKHCNEFYPLAGVTTNPTIISKEHTDFWKLVKGIREIIGEEKMLHVQTTQKKAEEPIESKPKIEKPQPKVTQDEPSGEKPAKAKLSVAEQKAADNAMKKITEMFDKGQIMEDVYLKAKNIYESIDSAGVFKLMEIRKAQEQTVREGF